MDAWSLNMHAGKEVERMADIINLTPHAIVVDNGVKTVTYEASGLVARIDTESKTIGEVDGFDIVSTTVVGDNLPDPKDDTLYIVSAMVKGLRPDRSDLVAPNTGAAKRNEKGHIVSVPGFIG